MSGEFCSSKSDENHAWFLACARCANLKCFWKNVHCPLRHVSASKKANWEEASSRRNAAAQRRINQAKEQQQSKDKSMESRKKHRKNWYGDFDKPSGYGRGKGAKGGKGGSITMSNWEDDMRDVLL